MKTSGVLWTEYLYPSSKFVFETLPPNMIVFEDKAFGKLDSYEGRDLMMGLVPS